MWTCTKCNQTNDDSNAVCVSCGTVRPNGRFGSAPANMPNNNPGMASAFARPANQSLQQPVQPVQQMQQRQPVQQMQLQQQMQPVQQTRPQQRPSQPVSQRPAFAPQPAQPVPPPAPYVRRTFSCHLGRFVGSLLLLLLPALAILLAWRQYDLLCPLLTGLLLPEDTEGLLRLISYIGFCLPGVLLTALPGIWTLRLCPPGPPSEDEDDEDDE